MSGRSDNEEAALIPTAILEIIEDTEPGPPKASKRERGSGGVGVWERTDKGNYYPIQNVVPGVPSRRFNLGWSQQQGSLFLGATKSVNDRLYASGMVELVLREIPEARLHVRHIGLRVYDTSAGSTQPPFLDRRFHALRRHE